MELKLTEFPKELFSSVLLGAWTAASAAIEPCMFGVARKTGVGLKPDAFLLTKKEAARDRPICIVLGRLIIIVFMFEPLAAVLAPNESLLKEVPMGPVGRKNEDIIVT